VKAAHCIRICCLSFFNHHTVSGRARLVSGLVRVFKLGLSTGLDGISFIGILWIKVLMYHLFVVTTKQLIYHYSTIDCVTEVYTSNEETRKALHQPSWCTIGRATGSSSTSPMPVHGAIQPTQTPARPADASCCLASGPYPSQTASHNSLLHHEKRWFHRSGDARKLEGKEGF
jgi:hypothetical protein